jgi:hypothetical protein
MPKVLPRAFSSRDRPRPAENDAYEGRRLAALRGHGMKLRAARRRLFNQPFLRPDQWLFDGNEQSMITA